MKVLPNGNIEITVQLMPEVYAALMTTVERDGVTKVDAINLALMTLDHVSKLATAAGKSLGEVDE